MNNHYESVRVMDIDTSGGLYPSCQGIHGLKRSSWKWKLQLLNLCGMIYFFLYSVTALVVGVTVALPELYKNNPDVLFYRVLAGWYIFSMLVVNHICIVRNYKRSVVDSSTCTALLNQTETSAEEKRWKQCFTCNQLVPPRAKHCPLCDRCVLKRDHHCFFAGCCIGFHNQRYFIVFCFYGTLGALYSLCIAIGYLEVHYAKLSSQEFYNYLVPWLLWRWFTSDITIGTVTMVVYSYCCVVTMAACAHYFLWQCMLLYTGQSSYEYVKGIRLYKRSLFDNMSSVFGPMWLLNFIFPMPFHNSGNGIEWNVSLDMKER
ncbi:palmitoyltransferase ZDHHC22-like [Haliotis rufescens]|uniref:palmitoyltransferase ZDHHC22-like n=1 Tax=Haliotis rufescens TaxID=6454 RepID=UPI001EAFE2A1|nr:palmitoyltransferase ZDHHC22-like [Haliotis rufescens]XP_046362498.1 palmitoyltransferase ZDHHC22-like [Haliotis rufescens]XP_046362499.1 palmitoyltransferase ZDHHC22-like [Haliotis rufescens]